MQNNAPIISIVPATTSRSYGRMGSSVQALPKQAINSFEGELKMEITAMHPKQTALVKQVSSPGQKKVATPDSETNNYDQVTADPVLLSKESLKLSQLSALSGSVKPAPIENSDHAQKAVDQVVSDIRNNPGQAQQVYGNVFQVNLQPLLA